MLRPYITPFALILGSVALIGALPAVADALAPRPMAEETQPSPPTTVRTLGVLDAQDMNKAEATDTDTMQPVQAGNVSYITGGIGDDERASLLAMKKNYNLRVMNMQKGGAYVGATHITVRDLKGGALLDLSAGPILLAQLPPGKYTLTASNEGHNRTEQVRLDGAKAAALNFTWN